MSRVLIIAEHDGVRLNIATARCVACAKQLGAESIDIIVLAEHADSVASAAAKLDSVNNVLVVENSANHHQLAAVLTPQILSLASDYSHVLAPGTTFGRDLMPRVAAKLGVDQVTDIMEVESERLFKRPVYAGNAVVKVEVPEGIVIGTVRTASFKAVAETGSSVVKKIVMDVALPSHTRFVGLETGGGSERPDLQSAARVVSGGRGVGSKENFDLIYQFADKIGAAVGASRAAVDAGYVANDMQVGQTGKIIAPDLYFAFGISGAIQHLAGIKDAGIIVAVNSDPDAPIFEIADIGLVGDLNEIIPQLVNAVE